MRSATSRRRGCYSARVAVADYLRRTRGVLADPQHIVLCSGATQAIALLASVLSGQTLAMEDPGFWFTGWCCDTTVSSLFRFLSMMTAWTSPPSWTAVRRRCWPLRPINRRPVWCSPRRDEPRWCSGRGRITWSSRTTTTPNTVTTVRLSARSRVSRPIGWCTWARRARRWHPGCGSGGWSCPHITSARSRCRKAWPTPEVR